MPDLGPPQLHSLILEALPPMICVVNREGKVLPWSAGAEQITGYFRQEVLGRPFPNDLLPEDPPVSSLHRNQFSMLFI